MVGRAWRRQLDQLIAPAAEECIAVEDYRVDTLLGEARKSGLDFAFAAGIADQELNAEGVRCSLDVFDLRARSWIRRIDEKTDHDAGQQANQRHGLLRPRRERPRGHRA